MTKIKLGKEYLFTPTPNAPWYQHLHGRTFVPQLEPIEGRFIGALGTDLQFVAFAEELIDPDTV
jgi:hypothetical protein